jgi:predicted NACHT family NTPase
MQKADYLLRLMKQQTDALVAKDEKLQQFLMWVSEKSLSVNVVQYKLAAVRAFYFSLARALDLTLGRAVDPALKSVSFSHPNFASALSLALDRGLAIDLNCTLYLYDIDYNFEFPSLCNVLDFTFIPHTYHVLEYVFYPAFNCVLVSELRQTLQKLNEQLPNPDGKKETFKQWWQANGHTWTSEFRSLMIKHRNIGHDWQFSEQQKEALKQYYDANKLLVDCLNSASNVTPEVRSHIEETLLLPIAEIEQRGSY